MVSDEGAAGAGYGFEDGEEGYRCAGGEGGGEGGEEKVAMVEGCVVVFLLMKRRLNGVYGRMGNIDTLWTLDHMVVYIGTYFSLRS